MASVLVPAIWAPNLTFLSDEKYGKEPEKMDKQMSVNKEDGMASKKMAKESISRGENSKPE